MNQTLAEHVEEGLAVQAAAGDARAFDRLAQSWNRRIYNFALRYLGNHDEAQEASQQTFIKAYRHIGSLQKGSQFRAWIYVIAGNTCRDALRKASRTATQPIDTVYEHPDITTHAVAETRLGREDMAKALRQALAKLPDEQRVVLILKEYEGLTFREIAQVLGEPESTLKTRLYTALKTMRRLLNHYKDERS